MGTLVVPLLLPCDAYAGPCESLKQLANQTASYYSSSGDPAHRAAAQNYRSAYNACLNNARQQTISPGGNPGAMFNALSGMLGMLGSMNSGGENSLDRRRLEEAARAEAVQLERDARARAEQLEREQAEQARVRAEEAERARLAAADQRARCLASNPFGSSSGCASDTSGVAGSPFRPCPRPLSSGCDWGGTGPSAQQKPPGASPFAKPHEDRPASAPKSPSAPRNAAPSLVAGNDNQYDSVLRVKCPGGIQPGCIADDWRRGFALLAERGKAVPKYKPPDYSELVISTEQYERIGRGETTFEEVETANYTKWMNNYTESLVADLEQRLAEIPEDPEALRVIERLRPRR